MAQKLLEYKGINSPQTLESLSDEDIIVICDVIGRPGGLVGGRMPDRGNQSSKLAAINFKLAAFMFKSMEHCSKPYEIRCVGSREVLEYQHQWKLDQKKIDDCKMP